MLTETREGVAWITFDHPERLNAFTIEDYVELREHVETALGDAEVRVIVLTGNGRAFSAGADRSLLSGLSQEEVGRAAQEFRAVVDAVGSCEKPVLAAVNGLAVGIGCTILLHCDLVLLAESARLRMPFTSLGMAPEAGSTYLLATRTRWPDATWALLSSEWIDSATALSMGLAWRVVPDDLLAEATQQAAVAIAAHDAAAVTATKRLLNEGRADAVQAAIEREFAATEAIVRRPSEA